jgi:hypothetical protein
MAMQKFAVLIEPWSVYVKEWSFFLEQGGRRQKWGRRWRPIMARDIESARRKGYRIRDGKDSPHAKCPLMALRRKKA